MAFLIMGSSSGLAIDVHYCQGTLKSLSFWGHAKNCHELAQSSHCKHKQSEMLCDLSDKKDCCKNEKDFIKLDQDQWTCDVEWELNGSEKLLAIVFPNSKVNAAQTDIKRYVDLPPQIPPLIQVHATILFQTFRI